MKKALLNLLKFITYKENKSPKEFYLPSKEEIEEYYYKDKETDSTDEKTQSKPKDSSEIKFPKKAIPVAEIQKKQSNDKPEADDGTISTNIDENINYIKKIFNSPKNKDLVLREFIIAGNHRAFIAYIDGMVNNIIINNFILRPLLTTDKIKSDSGGCQLDEVLKSVLETNQAKEVKEPQEAIYEILSGNTILYIDGCNYYVTNETKGFDKRGVETPQTEGLVKGPQEAFNESIRTNITLVRKIIKSPNLTTEFFKLGRRSKTLCAIMYIKGLVNPALVDEVKRRLDGIDTDFLCNSGMLEQLIEDKSYALVPSVINTERPDRTSSHIVEGKIAIFLDGTPFVIIVPATLPSLIHSPEDSALKWQYATFLRLIRVFAIFLATLLPGLYVAITNFHQEMLPTDLLIAIAKAKENVPFPTIVEIILMELSFELIREAGIRVPGIIGNTLGIIGALILGQAAVQANIVSPVLIIIVAITGLGNFAVPNFSLAFGIRLLRFIFIITGALLGFYGISLTMLIFVALLCNTNSFGVPFLSPIIPKTRRSRDLYIRWPLWMQELRPDIINPMDERRQPPISKKWSVENPYSTKNNIIAKDEEDNDGQKG